MPRVRSRTARAAQADVDGNNSDDNDNNGDDNHDGDDDYDDEEELGGAQPPPSYPSDMIPSEDSVAKVSISAYQLSSSPYSCLSAPG